jgi:imidazolonepropionase-like amidohydrolase
MAAPRRRCSEENLPKSIRRAFLMVFIFTCVSVSATGTFATVRQEPCSILEVRRYFDGEKLIEGKKSFILIEKGIITGISSHEPLAKSQEPLAKGQQQSSLRHCKKVDLTSFLVAPGMIDGHTHLLFTDRSYGRDFSKEIETFAAVSDKRRLEEAGAHALSMLEAGFTSVRDLGNSGQFLDLELREQIRTGQTSGPRIFGSGPGIAVREAQFSPGTPKKMVAREYKTISSATQASAIVDSLKKRGVDLVKAYADNDPNPHTMPLGTLSALTREAAKVGLPVAVHATNESSVKAAIAARAHSIEHAYEISDESLKKMAEVGSILVPTDLGHSTCRVLSVKAPESKPASCENETKTLGRRLKSALSHGVVIAFGSDAYLELQKNHQDRGPVALDSLTSYVEAGLSPLETLRAATWGGARLLRREDLGTIRAGASADIIAFAQDPLQKFENIRTVTFIMQAGRIHNSKKLDPAPLPSYDQTSRPESRGNRERRK